MVGAGSLGLGGDAAGGLGGRSGGVGGGDGQGSNGYRKTIKREDIVEKYSEGWILMLPLPMLQDWNSTTQL